MWDKILLLALPLAASSILQQLFNAADVAVVGRFAGSNALAAVGANAPVINLFVNLMVGLSIGSNVVLANAIGAGDNDRIKKGVHTSVTLAVLSGLLMLAAGILFARPILLATSCPIEILEAAVLYLRIYMIGIPFTMLYNFEAAILRAKGDTKTPLMVLIVSGVINLALNVFFVIVLHMTVEGVAIATVISGVLSAVVLWGILRRESGPLRLELRSIGISGSVLKQVVSVGLPAGIQGTMFSISNLIVQAAVNLLGAEVIAANSVAVNYEYFGFYIISAFSSVVVTFIGQNYGAGQYGRCRQVLRTAMFLAITVVIVYNTLVYIFARECMAVFSTEAAVIEIGMIRLRRSLIFETINVVMELQSGALRGLGKSLPPALICIGGICGVRVLWVYTVFRIFTTYECLVLVYPISWLISTIGIAIACHIIMKKKLA